MTTFQIQTTSKNDASTFYLKFSLDFYVLLRHLQYLHSSLFILFKIRSHTLFSISFVLIYFHEWFSSWGCIYVHKQLKQFCDQSKINTNWYLFSIQIILFYCWISWLFIRRLMFIRFFIILMKVSMYKIHSISNLIF